MLAAYLGREDITRCLLNNKADQAGIDSMGRNALMWAVAGGRDDVVTLLLDRGTKIDTVDKLGYTPLMFAAQFGQATIVDSLLESGARYVPNQDNTLPTPLQLAARWGWIDVVKTLLSRYPQMEHVDWADGRGWTALMEASSNGCTEVVKFLLEKEARVQLVDESFRNAVHIAALRGHVAVVDQLLSSRPDLINETDALGASALLLSVDQVRLPVSELLIARGAEFKADKEGFTVGHIAALAGMIDVLDMLNKKDRRLLDQAENRGRTPLLLAASKGNVDVCRYLVQEAGVNMFAVDLDGLTALMHAARGGHEVVVKFLLETNPQLFLMTDESCNTAVDYAPRSEMRSKLKATPLPLESYIRERLDKVHTRLDTIKTQQALPKGIEFSTQDAEFESIRANLVRSRVERQYDFVTRIMSVALARPIAAYNNVTPRWTAVEYLKKRVVELETRPPATEVSSPDSAVPQPEPSPVHEGNVAAPSVHPLERATEAVRNRARLVMALTERLQRKQRVVEALKTRADVEALSHGEARISEYQRAVQHWETQKADLANERLALSNSITNVSQAAQPLKSRFGQDGTVNSAAPLTSLIGYAQLIDTMSDRFHNDFLINTTKLHQDIEMLNTVKNVVGTQCHQLMDVYGKDCEELQAELTNATAEYKQKYVLFLGGD
jgi:ankyrin repeat protein